MPPQDPNGFPPRQRPVLGSLQTDFPGEKRCPTIRDLATLAGLHFTTVSKALNEDPRIAESTRAKVRGLAAKVGYVRDPVAMALTRFRKERGPRRGPNLAFVTNHPTRESFMACAHMRQFLEGAETQAKRYGYGLELLLSAAPSEEGASLARRMAQNACEGAILGALHSNLPRPRLEDRRFPLVRIDSRYLAHEVPLVTNDQIQVVRLAAARVRALGYRRVALLVSENDEATTGNQFASGWLAVQEDLPAQDRVPLLRYKFQETGAELCRRMEAWVERHQVDAFLLNLDQPQWLWETLPGFKPPAFASLGLSCSDGRVAGVVQNFRLVGEVAVDVLVGELRRFGRACLPVEVRVPGDWHDGQSLPPVA